MSATSSLLLLFLENENPRISSPILKISPLTCYYTTYTTLQTPQPDQDTPTP